MQKKMSLLNDRTLWIYYALFFSGSLVLIYEVQSFNFVGDSVNFLCFLFLLNSLNVRRWINIIENALLVTLGYILPLLIRNSLKLPYNEAASITDFSKSAMISSLMTFLLGAFFTTLGFLATHFGKKIWRFRRDRITTRSL